LGTLSEEELAAVLPRQRGIVGMVFPVMRRLPPVATAPLPDQGTLDPLVLRARLFFALRDLFTRLAQRRPAVVSIADLQWADADSLALLAGVMHYPGSPRILLLATLRTGIEPVSLPRSSADPASLAQGGDGIGVDTKEGALVVRSLDEVT